VGFLKFIGWLATNLVAVAAACVIFDGIGFPGSSGWDEVTDNFWPLVFVALILGIVNSFVSPIIKFLSLPFIVITLGLFLLVINALMLLFVEWLVGLFGNDFFVDGFWNAVGGSIVITIVTWVVGLLFGDARDDYYRAA
jgi:putative membrane protein